MVLHKVWINSFFLQSKVLFLSCPLPFLFYWLCFWNFFPLYLSFPFLPFPFLPSSLLPPFLSPLFSSFLPSFCSSLNNCFSLFFLQFWTVNQLRKSFEGWENKSLTTGKTSVQNLVWISQRYGTFWPTTFNSQSPTRRHVKCYWDGPRWQILQHTGNWKKPWNKLEGMILLFGCSKIRDWHSQLTYSQTS